MKSSAACSSAVCPVSSAASRPSRTASQSHTSQDAELNRKKQAAGSIVIRRPSTVMPGRRAQRGSNGSGSSTESAGGAVMVVMVSLLSGRLLLE